MHKQQPEQQQQQQYLLLRTEAIVKQMKVCLAFDMSTGLRLPAVLCKGADARNAAHSCGWLVCSIAGCDPSATQHAKQRPNIHNVCCVRPSKLPPLLQVHGGG
jgi:hypothetical protein